MIEVYRDPKVLATMMIKIMETKDQYYIDCDGVVRIRYNGKWVPYLEVMKKSPALYCELIAHKVISVAANTVVKFNRNKIDPERIMYWEKNY